MLYPDESVKEGKEIRYEEKGIYSILWPLQVIPASNRSSQACL